MEAQSRIELENKGFADLRLTTWLSRLESALNITALLRFANALGDFYGKNPAIRGILAWNQLFLTFMPLGASTMIGSPFRARSVTGPAGVGQMAAT